MAIETESATKPPPAHADLAPLRVLHVISTIDPAEGGPPVIVTRLAAAQAALGHDVRLLSQQSPAAEKYRDHCLEVVPGARSVKYEFVPHVSRTMSLFSGKARRVVDRLLEGVDFVHVHSIWHPLLRITMRACRRRGIPYFVLLNGMLDPWSLGQKRTKKRIALALGYRDLFQNAAALHLGNTEEGELIEPLKLGGKRIIIPNGVFFEEIEPLPSPGAFRQTLPALGDRPFILFLSRLHYKKGPDILAEAFAGFAKRNHDAHLVVAGPDGGALADFEQRIERAGVGDRVHVVGPLYDDRKFAAFVDADCFCLPSRQEGFSVAVTEAMACGIPLVICEGCHRPEVATSGAGRVVDLDAGLVADALVEVMADAAARAEMGRRGRALIESAYTWGKIAEQTVSEYRSVIGTR